MLREIRRLLAKDLARKQKNWARAATHLRVGSIEQFSEEEAPTVAYAGDRPTPDYRTSTRLLRLAGALAPQDPQGSDAEPAQAAATEEPNESAFWDTPPRYSTTTLRPAAQVSLPPAPQPSRSRRVLAKLLFSVLLLSVLTLLGYEVSTMFRITWSDVRALYTRT